MTKKNLVTLILLLSLLVGVFFFTQQKYEGTDNQQTTKLFSDIDGGKVARIVIEQGSSHIELASGVEGKDGWVLPVRANYPADLGKVNALLLKLLDLSVSQKVTESEQKFEQLGVTDASVKNGKGKITLSDKDNHVLGGLFLGEPRKGKGGGGQFIRRIGAENIPQNKVYLIAEPLSTATDLASWLDITVANVLQSELETVTQLKIADTGEQKEFELKKSGMKNKVPEFIIDPPLTGEEQMNAVTFSQVRSALENLRLSDVLQSSDPSVKEFVFDNKTLLQLSSGLTYAVSTVQKEPEKCYAKLSVDFNQSFADEVKKQFVAAQEEEAKKKAAQEQAKKEAEANKPEAEKTAAEEKPGAETPEATGDDASKPAADKPALEAPKLSTPDDAQKLRAKYEPWVFELPEYMCSKFRHKRTDLIQAKKDAQAEAGAGGGEHE